MKVFYIAASAARQADARKVAALLEDRGARVQANWLKVADVSYGRAGVEDELPYHAQTDMQDVINCDEVVCLSGDAYTKGGRHAEVGAAIAIGKRVWLVGPREHVFHYHPLVTVVEDVKHVDVSEPESGMLRRSVRVGVVDKVLCELRLHLLSALKKHGNGKFISAHETLGVLTEEYDETINAVRNNSEGQIIQELFDVAQTAVFGVASMRVRG
jgi:hypothetical protein